MIKKILFVVIGVVMIGISIYAGILWLRRAATNKSIPDFLTSFIPEKLNSKLGLPSDNSSAVEPAESTDKPVEVNGNKRPETATGEKKKIQDRIVNQQLLSQQVQQVSQQSISDVQRTLRTIEEINRMNRTNQQLQQMQRQSQSPRSPQKQ